MTEFATVRPKTYSYLTDDNEENKKARDTKKCIIKHCFETTQLENKINELEKKKLIQIVLEKLQRSH